MIALRVYGHMVNNTDMFHASYIAANAQCDVAQQYNGEIYGDYIRFKSLEDSQIEEITKKYPFILRDKFAFFY